MPRTRLAAQTLAGLLIEDVVQRAGRGRQRVANTLAGVEVEVSVGAAVPSWILALTHTLTGLEVQFLIRAAHICREDVCRDGGNTQLRYN